MKIPVFVSCPSELTKSQKASKELIELQLAALDFELRQLGLSDYPTELPLREVLVLAKRCSGAVILGFEQIRLTAGAEKPNTPKVRQLAVDTPFPSPWNNLEAGILFSLGLPMLVFKEDGITGGVFDHGVTDVFIHRMPQEKSDPMPISKVFQKWGSAVRSQYYA